MRALTSVLTAALLLGPAAAVGQQAPPSPAAEVAAVVERFHAALKAGDSAAVLALLAPDAVILEAGGVETREEYRSHHLPGDIAFAQATTSDPGTPTVMVRGDVAWVSSVGRTYGTYRGRDLDLTGAELMVLTRTPDGWKVAAVHWSSRARAR